MLNACGDERGERGKPTTGDHAVELGVLGAALQAVGVRGVARLDGLACVRGRGGNEAGAVAQRVLPRLQRGDARFLRAGAGHRVQRGHALRQRGHLGHALSVLRAHQLLDHVRDALWVHPNLLDDRVPAQQLLEAEALALSRSECEWNTILHARGAARRALSERTSRARLRGVRANGAHQARSHRFAAPPSTCFE